MSLMRKVLPLFLLFFCLQSFAQKEANFWYFGQNAALDFNSGAPLPTGSAASNQLNTVEGCSTFSDPDGNLLFYIGAPSPTATNLTIWNRNNQPMPFSDVANGGQLLNGDASSSQSALTVPAPNNPNIYYIFTVGAQSSGNAGFWFYTVDMTVEGGRGDVVAGPTALNDGTPLPVWSEKVTAVRGEECNTFWVVSYVQGDFIAYKVDESGVDIINPVRSSLGNTSFNGGTNPDARGYLKVSPDGTKMVAAHMTSGTFIFDFDDSTGIVSNPRELDTDGRNGYGVEFSPSSRRLYVSTGNFVNSQEFLYQFDVVSDDIATINASRFTVFDYFNSRGALQLGPDNRIYWTSDGFQNISVINNPEELGSAVNYEHQVIDVGTGRLATQGLPPFLSSLLLPIDIIDEDNGQVLNDQTIPFCTGDDKTITPQGISGTNISYAWSFDDGTGPNVIATTPSLILTNLNAANAGLYSVEIILTDDCGINTTLSGEFTVEIFESATTNNNVSELIFCDTDNDGFNTFDLKALKDLEILDGQDPGTFEVFYYLTEFEALENENPIDIPYTNPTPFSNQTIWARVQNRNAAAACFAITSFRLAVTGFPVPTPPTDYVLCDNEGNGIDTDGFVQNFVLNTKDNEILGSLSATQYNVTYHLNANDADTNFNPIDKVNPYTNINPNTQQIFVRVESVDNAACYDAGSSFNLVVGALPVLENTVINLEDCDFDGTLDGIANVNLTQVNDQVSLDATSFKYYETLSAAQNDGISISNPTSYRNTNSPTNFSYWVRALSDFDCFRIARVDVLVSAVGSIPQGVARNYFECDDFLDINGDDNANNDDTDGITSFDFSDVVPEIRALFPPNENIEITFYKKQVDADLKKNPIKDITNYRNIGFPNTQIIFARADNLDQSSCEGVSGYIQLNVDVVPDEPNPADIQDLRLCDNDDDGVFDNGIVQTFNLDSQIPSLLGSSQDPADFTVTFHETQPEANTGENAISNTAAYENSVPNLETIYVRIENNTTGCFTAKTNFDLIVDPLPVVGTITPLEICDDNSDGSAQNGFSQIIDLESKTEEILGGQDPSNFRVTYHLTQRHINPLSSPFTNTEAGTQTIYVRVLNLTTLCDNDFFNFNVIVNPEPTVEVIAPLEECDNTDDGDDRNGFVQTFNLDSQIPSLLGSSQNPADFIVTFHETQPDANTGANPLDSPYTNTTANRQTIFVRIENRTTGCLNFEGSFEIIVNPLPEFEVTPNQIVCLNTNGITLSPENPADTYDYFWTNDTTGQITNGEDLLVTNAGSYTVTGTTIDGTNCSRSLTINVDESNIATLERSWVTIYDESNNNGIDDEIFISIDTVNNDLGPGDYQFALLNTENGKRIPFAGYQDEPRFEDLEGGIYQILVNDKNGCSPDTTLLISVIQFPKFFTPNGDTVNDTWTIKGADSRFYPNSRIYVFDRFGKPVANFPLDGPGWDGTFNGKVLPSDDYWFSIHLIEPDGTVRERKGNFSLIRGERR